jgi:hypothetical protein
MMGGTWPSPSPQLFYKIKNDPRKRTTTIFSTPSLNPSHFFYKTKKKNIDPSENMKVEIYSKKLISLLFA